MRVGFIGLGKLGRDAAEVLAEQHEVVGYDPNVNVPGLSGTLEEACKDKDVVLIAVQTPHDPKYDGKDPTSHLPPKEFDYSYVIEATKQVDALVNKGTLISVISTVLPGTMRRDVVPHVKNGMFIYNPYLIAQGTVKWDMKNPEMIMIGTEDGNESTITHTLRDLYDPILNQVAPRYVIGTWEEIEAMKIFYNTFISNKIALVNMIQDVAHKLGHMNVDKVTQALAKSTQRIVSPAYMKAGMGDGGACHPRDNIALRWLAKELDLGYDLFESIMTAREGQAEAMAKAILTYGKHVHFTSDSYKPGTTLVDGSYSLLVQYYIKKHGGQVVTGIDNNIEVIVLVHSTDQIVTEVYEKIAKNNVTIFDPWRTYPKAENVIHYGKN